MEVKSYAFEMPIRYLHREVRHTFESLQEGSQDWRDKYRINLCMMGWDEIMEGLV